MTDNIFDLSKFVGASNDIETKPATQSDIDASLVGYEPVALSDWKNIPYGSYIRYVRKDGAFRRGGIVQGVWSNKDSSGAEVIKIDITAGFGAQTSKWSITSNSVEKVWIKRQVNQINHTASHGLTDMSELREDIDFCKDSIKQLTKEMQKMQSDQVRITGLLKKIIDSRGRMV